MAIPGFTTKYAKEDLPTYSEILHEFWEKGYWRCSSANPEDPLSKELMPYWGIPKYKYFLATVCNQFNKMLYVDSNVGIPQLYSLFAIENGLDYDGVDPISCFSGKNIELTFTTERHCFWMMGKDLKNWLPHFVISREGYYDEDGMRRVSDGKQLTRSIDYIPMIYQLDFPNGKENPFAIPDSNVRRIKLSELNGVIELKFVWNSHEGFYRHLGKPIEMIWDRNHKKFEDLLRVFMDPIIKAMSI